MRDLLPLPKANLHVHLEATVRPQMLAEMAAAHGTRLWYSTIRDAGR